MSNDSLKRFTAEDSLRISTFADRAPVRLSSDGRFLSYTIENRNGEVVKEQAWVTDVDSGEHQQILPEAIWSWAAGWSPVEPVVALVVDMGDGPKLWVHNAETGETRYISPAALAYTPFHFHLPQWTPDGNAFICTLASRIGQSGYNHLGMRVTRKAAPADGSGEDGVTVRYWESPVQSKTDDAEEHTTQSHRCWSTLARIDLNDGSVTPLVEDIQCDCWEVSPDGKYVAYLQFIDCKAGDNIYQLCVVNMDGGETRVLDPHVVEDYAVSLSWSPDSMKIAYCPNHEAAVVDLSDDGPHMVMPFDGGIIGEFYEAPLWSPDGSFLLATRHSSVWKIPLDGGKAIDLLPDRGTVGVRGIAAPGGGPSLWSPGGESVIVEMRDWKSGEIGLARIGLSGEGILKSALCMQMLSDVPRYHLDVSPNRGLLTFVRQSATNPQDVWMTDASLESSKRITNLNPHVDERQFSTPRLITWVGSDGREHRSAYFPPVGDIKEPHPVIFSIYAGGRSALLSMFGCEPVINVQIFTNHGYGVCVPDLRISSDRWPQSICELLSSAVQALVAEGIADPARIGLIGHSIGGYMVNSAITTMDCFAAAVSSTGFTNWTSVYGTPSPSGDQSWCESAEFGWPKLGAPPWENPQKYIEYSPLFALDHITTPVLIVHGDKDDCVSQAWELFSGLRRLGKPAALAIYQGEDHAQCDWRLPNFIDFWNRTLEWFDRFMMKDGVSSPP